MLLRERVVQTLEDFLAALSAIARPEIREDHTAQSCVASTWITLEVMRHFRVPARPITVKAEIFNAPAAGFKRQHGRRPYPGESESSWIVGIGFGTGDGIVGTHVIVLVDERIIVDVSIDQGNAPEHGIELPGVVVGEIDALFLSGRRIVFDISGQQLIYIPDDTRIDLATLPDFKHNPQTDSAVERIVMKLEAQGFYPFA